MKNIWLSNLDYQINKIKRINEATHAKPDDDEEMPEDEEEMPEDEEEDDDEEEGPESKLNNRQKMMYELYEEVVEMHGKFNQTAKANGAHYAPASANPFKDKGMACANCVYFIGGGGCEIVSGKIEPMAICKLWIIPEELIKK
jgi:hypothetical protein